MDTKEIRALCLKRVYGAAMTERERDLVNDFTQTTDGMDYMRECREMKGLLSQMGDVSIKPVDHEAMVETFERTVRQSFDETVFRPWWEANSPAVILGLMAGLFIVFDDGWSIINAVLLALCVLWLIADYFQRYYFAKTLSRPDLYEYAKASRQRSDRILRNLPGQALVAVVSLLAIAAVSYATYWGYQKFGLIVPAIVVFVVIETAVIFVYHHRKRKRTNAEVWDWWAEEIKE